MSGTKGTSLIDQNEALKKKWGGDTLNYDINGAIKGYDANLAKYNDAATSQAEKDKINAIYGGDITTWDNKNAYANYMSDLSYIQSVDALNNAYTGAVDKAKQSESRAMQYADTRRQLMQKYLPETLMAQGVAHTGYTADALLKAENNYNQYVLGAMGDRAAAEQDAFQSYQDALQGYKTQKAQNDYQVFLNRQAQDEQSKATYAQFIASIDEGADMDSLMEQAKNAGLSASQIADLQKYSDNAVKKAQDEAYKFLQDNVGTWTKETLDESKDILTEEQYNTLLNALPNNTYLGKDAMASNYAGASGTGRDLISNPTENDVFSLKIGDETYKLKTGVTVPNHMAVYNVADKVSDGQVFMYSGKLFVKNGNVIQSIKEGAKGYAYVYEALSEKAYKN